MWWLAALAMSLVLNRTRAATVFVLGRHGAKVTSPFAFRPFLGPAAAAKLAASPAGAVLVAEKEDQAPLLRQVFGAEPGTLTPLSQRCEKAMGALLGERYGPGLTYFLYADDDTRDQQGAAAFGAGLQEAQATGSSSPDASQPQLLAEGKDGKLFAGCPRATGVQVAQSALGSACSSDAACLHAVDAWSRSTYAAQIAALSEHVGFDLRQEPTRWAGDPAHLPYYGTVSGPLQATCKFAQHFLNEAALGVASPSYAALGVAAPGEAGYATLVQLNEACDGLFRLYKNSVNGQRFGLELNAALLAAMEAAVGDGPESAVVKHGPERGLLLYEGHDVNQAFLASALGLEWHFPDAPHSAAPYDSKIALVLEHGGRTPTVRAEWASPSVAQMAGGCDRLNAVRPLRFRGCPDPCPWSVVRTRLERSLAEARCLTGEAQTWLAARANASVPRTPLRLRH